MILCTAPLPCTRVLHCESIHRPGSRCTPVLFAEPAVELPAHLGLGGVACDMPHLVFANLLASNLSLERVADERRAGRLAGPSHLVDHLQQPVIDLIWMIFITVDSNVDQVPPSTPHSIVGLPGPRPARRMVAAAVLDLWRDGLNT